MVPCCICTPHFLCSHENFPSPHGRQRLPLRQFRGGLASCWQTHYGTASLSALLYPSRHMCLSTCYLCTLVKKIVIFPSLFAVLLSLLFCIFASWLPFSSSGVALVLCQSDPVLNDGQTGGDSSRKSVIDGESKRLIEKFVTEQENADDDSSSDWVED